MQAHGLNAEPVPLEALLSDDPDLWLVTADPNVWDAAHPCECDGVCVCDA